MTYISSQSFTAPLRAYVLQAQSALSQAQTEVASGAPADVGLTLGGGTGNLLSLRSQVDALHATTASNATASTRLSTTATTLGALLTSAQGVSTALIAAASPGAATDTLQANATAALKALTAGLNTTVGNQNIFGGINTAGAAPVADYFSTTTSKAKAAVDASFSTFLAGPPSQDPATLTGAQLQGFLDNSATGGFSDGFSDANWGENWSTASDTALQTTIAPSQSVATSVSANDAAFRQLAQGYTILGAFTGANLSADARATAIAAATKLVNAGIASLTQVQSGVGLAQAAIDTANTQLGAQADLLQTTAGDLDSVDTYALSSRVTSLQTQLEASYELTSRLQQLSLTNYLTS